MKDGDNMRFLIINKIVNIEIFIKKLENYQKNIL